MVAFSLRRVVKESECLPVKHTALALIRVVDGTVVKEPGKTGSRWRILYSLRLPSLACDFFELTATMGEGCGESLESSSSNFP